MSSATQNTDKTIDHLILLRQCLIRCVLAITVIFIGLFAFSNNLFELIATPLLNKLPNNSQMIATGVTSTFVAPLKLTFFISLFIAMPVILYQIWHYLAPALYKKERVMIWPLLLSSTVLFYSGVLFAYYVVFPLLFAFFINIAPNSIEVMPDLNQYINFCLKLFFAFGLAFEVPVATVVCVLSSLVSLESLRSKRAYVIVLAFVVGMLLTPPDVLSQILLAIPLYILFEAGIVLASLYKSR